MSPKHQGLSFGVVENKKLKRRHSMKYYAGLDVSMKETFICILNDLAVRVKEILGEDVPSLKNFS